MSDPPPISSADWQTGLVREGQHPPSRRSRSKSHQLRALIESEPHADPTKERGWERTLDTEEEEEGEASPNGGPRYPPRTFQPDGERRSGVGQRETTALQQDETGRQAAAGAASPGSASRVHPG